jgi:uncharacterized membrane protein
VPTPPPPNNAESNHLRTALDEKIGPLVPKQQRREIVARVHRILVSENFSGPMPHPRHLEGYEQILPGSAERILSMAEKAQDHNIAMETLIVRAEIDDQKRGMRYGLAGLLVALALAGYSAFLGRADLAAIFTGTVILGAVTLFVRGRSAD